MKKKLSWKEIVIGSTLVVWGVPIVVLSLEPIRSILGFYGLGLGPCLLMLVYALIMQALTILFVHYMQEEYSN